MNLCIYYLNLLVLLFCIHTTLIPMSSSSSSLQTTDALTPLDLSIDIQENLCRFNSILEFFLNIDDIDHSEYEKIWAELISISTYPLETELLIEFISKIEAFFFEDKPPSNGSPMEVYTYRQSGQEQAITILSLLCTRMNMENNEIIQRIIAIARHYRNFTCQDTQLAANNILRVLDEFIQPPKCSGLKRIFSDIGPTLSSTDDDNDDT